MIKLEISLESEEIPLIGVLLVEKDEFIEHVSWLISSFFVTCGDSMFKQVIGISMGTDGAPFLANLFLFCL
jgi:hypothetical protein